MNENEEMLKKIQIEDSIWILYLVLIGMSFYANELEKEYYLYHLEESKKSYQRWNIVIFSILLVVYWYFFQDNYKSVYELKCEGNSSKLFFNEINLFATSLILIAGLIFLYIAIYDTELETEIAFS